MRLFCSVAGLHTLLEYDVATTTFLQGITRTRTRLRLTPLYLQVRKALPKKLPRFLEEGAPPELRQSLEHSPEFWFGKKKKAGARAHIDAHTEFTITIQLASAKQ